MKRISVISLGILTIALMMNLGCGGSDPAPAAPASKELFSSWAEVSPAGGMVLDMLSMGFGVNSIAITITAGGECTCVLTIGGTEDSGNYSLTSCSFNSLGTSATDPGCSSFNGNDTYTNSGGVLTLCRVGTTTCSTWK